MSALIEMELSRIITSDINDQQIIYLHEVDGRREFPILIGPYEAMTIERRVKGEVHPRPLTHDLLKNVLEQLGAEPHDIIINSLHEHTYYAVIRLMQDGELVEVDSRPSDAIALAMHYDPPLPIYVDQEVLDSVSSS
ncbi:MAG: bifunctional nuclease family protein [Planctomycetaceae bacterium]|nr:bifunctional nuclease family protein [Planctomycetaceae bacterium]